MKMGAPYLEFAFEFRRFLKDRGFATHGGEPAPADFHRDIVATMGESAPSRSEVYMVFYGARRFNGVTLAFMGERYGFRPSWRALLAIKTVDGQTLKQGNFKLPGIRELRKKP